MGHKAGERQIPVALPPQVIRDLQMAAIRLQEDVPRERAMNRGPMLGYVARWFLKLPLDRQLEIVLAGKAVEDEEAGRIDPGGSVPAVAAADADLGKGVEVSRVVTKRARLKGKNKSSQADR